MPRKPNAQFVPTIERSLLRKLQTPDSWMLDLAIENIDKFNEVLGSIPRRYEWRFLSAEAFQKIVSSLSAADNASDLYRIYWEDMLGQIQAFSIMSAWRLAEIVRSAVWATRRDDVLCAAIMSRAALETTAAYAWFQTEIRPTLEKIGQGHTPTLVEDLEKKVLKVVFASRLEDTEEFYKPTNIVTIIGHIAKKIPDQKAIVDVYFALCEVAHPNLLGRSIYVTPGETIDIPGHEKRTISMNHGPSTIVILRDSISALSWSCGTFSLSCVALQESVRKMVSHLSQISGKA